MSTRIPAHVKRTVGTDEERIDAPVRRFLVVAAVLVVAAWVAVAARFVLWPVQDSVGRADAVVVLAGDHLRLGKALELMTRRVAPTLVISDGLAPAWERANRLCRGGVARFRVVCFRASPYSTRGEAETVARLARARGWRSVVVVTSTYHVTRARLLFRRCVDGRVDVTGATYQRSLIPLEVVLEPAKLLYSLVVARGC
jgi:uncharacterized SAM-binding protein YcdF (DUF218 family)